MSKKFSIKDIKSPDKFFKAMLTFIGYLRHNVKMYLAISGAIIAITAIVVVIKSINGSREEKARRTLYELTVKLQDVGVKTPDEVIKTVTPVLDKLGNTNAGLEARYMVSEMYYEKGDWDNAVKNYNVVIKKGDGLIKELAMLGVAYSIENKGDVQGALANYLKLKDMNPSVYKAVAMLGIGRCYQKLGDKNKALSSYETIIISYPDTDYARLASAAKTGL